MIIYFCYEMAKKGPQIKITPAHELISFQIKEIFYERLWSVKHVGNGSITYINLLYDVLDL